MFVWLCLVDYTSAFLLKRKHFLDAWLTEDLLNKLGNNDKLMTMMADPRCEKALQEFQANPDKALITYQHDKYIQAFFREFCDVLG